MNQRDLDNVNAPKDARAEASPASHGAEEALDRVEDAVDDVLRLDEMDDAIAGALEEGLTEAAIPHYGAVAGADDAGDEPADLPGEVDDEIGDKISRLIAEIDRLDDGPVPAADLQDEPAAPDHLEVPATPDTDSNPPVTEDHPELRTPNDEIDEPVSWQPAQHAGSSGDAAPAQAWPEDVSSAVLGELDETLADDVAHLFQSDTSTLESVLEGIFDEKAIFVQDELQENVGGPSAPAAGDRPRGRVAVRLTAKAAANNPDAHADPADDLAGDLETAQRHIARDVDDEMAGGRASQAIAAAGQVEISSEAESTPPPEDIPVESMPAHESSKAATCRRDLDRVPSAGRPAPSSPAASRPEARSSRRPPNDPVDGEDGGQAMAGTLVITALVAMNWPMRLVPRPMRPYVDLFALTVLIWVPIVWVVAWLMG